MSVSLQEPLLRHLLRSLALWYERWRAGSIRDDYLSHCGTIGRRVRVELPDGGVREGVAVDIDDDGRLVVSTPDGHLTVAAGDVVHVR
jgi:BirA family biotin operon repressor/biotin-[acetyl-CoA-carboxylase] ligase